MRLLKKKGFCGRIKEIGPSPSGKALGFGPSIRRFESCRSSHMLDACTKSEDVVVASLQSNPAGPANFFAKK